MTKFILRLTPQTTQYDILAWKKYVNWRAQGLFITNCYDRTHIETTLEIFEEEDPLVCIYITHSDGSVEYIQDLQDVENEKFFTMLDKK